MSTQDKMVSLSAIGLDTPGLVSTITTRIFEMGGNIVDVEEYARRDLFFIFLVIDFSTSARAIGEITSTLKAIEDEARLHEYIAIICTGEMNAERERAYVDYLLSRQVEGLMLCCYVNIMENKSFIQKVAQKVPIIVMDQPSGNLPVSAAYADGYKGFKMLLSYLIEKGHRNIGMIRSLRRYPCSESRFIGYVDTLKENGITVDPNLIEESEFTAAGGYDAAKKLLAKSKPTAIVGVNDLIASGALKYIREKGYSVPDDIAIAGFDNIALSSLVSPQLTTVNIPVEEIAHEAINQLIKKIQNPRVRNRDIVIETQLIIRQSTEKVMKDIIRM